MDPDWMFRLLKEEDEEVHKKIRNIQMNICADLVFIC